MFDLEKAITQWRSELIGNQGIAKEAMEELESHLRDSVDELTGSMALEDAFREAVQSLGSPKDLASEFEKDGPIALADRVVLGGIVLFSGLALIISLEAFFRFNSGLAQVIKWYFALYEIGTHLAHIVGGIGAYYILRYTVKEKEETSFNILFAKSLRILLPIAALFMWTALAIYITRNGPEFPYHTIHAALLITAPLYLLPLCWSKRLSRIHLAQTTILFWASILLAIHLKDHRADSDSFMPVVLVVIVLIGLLPWVKGVRQRLIQV